MTMNYIQEESQWYKQKLSADTQTFVNAPREGYKLIFGFSISEAPQFTQLGNNPFYTQFIQRQAAFADQLELGFFDDADDNSFHFL